MGGKGDGKKGSDERPRSRGRAKAQPQPAPKGRSSSAPGRPKAKAKPEVEDEKFAVNRRPGRASSTNSRRPEPKPPRQQKRDWEHPEGMPFKELREGTEVTGVVVNVSIDHGVFLDIGYERNVILSASRRFWRRFRRGDIMEHLVVSKVDVKQKLGAVSIEDVQASLSVSRVPMEEIKKGSYVNGVVDNKNSFGVFVNIGVEGRHGRLQVPRSLGMQLQRGQILRDLYIGSVDIEQGRISLMLDDVEGAIEDMEMVSAHALLPDVGQSTREPREREPRERSPPPETKAKAKPKAKAAEKKKPAAAKDPKETKARRAPVVEQLEEDYEEDVDLGIEVGDLVDGIVVKISAKSVLVDIGGPGRGNLQVPSELRAEFRRGDRVQGMKVEKISRAGVITLSMDDPELEVDYQPSKSGSHNGKGESPKEKGKGKGKGSSKGNSKK